MVMERPSRKRRAYKNKFTGKLSTSLVEIIRYPMFELLVSLVLFFRFGRDLGDFFGVTDVPPKKIKILTLPNLIFICGIANVVLDAFFIKKLHDENEEDLWLRMLIATASTFATTFIFGPVLLYKIEQYNPDDFDPLRVDMAQALRHSYWAHWGFIEVSAFLVEDATTIYSYLNYGEKFGDLNPPDMINICMSLLSGILSSSILVWMLFRFFAGTRDLCKMLFPGILSLFLTGYAGYVTVYGLFLGHAKTELVLSPGNMELLTILIGAMFQLSTIESVPTFYCSCCADTWVYWPTRDGELERQGNLYRLNP